MVNPRLVRTAGDDIDSESMPAELLPALRLNDRLMCIWHMVAIQKGRRQGGPSRTGGPRADSSIEPVVSRMLSRVCLIMVSRLVRAR
ncbi:MAG: hypothetical protein JO279_16280 [Verrucomicrobia bacterium]|nr:hypothetical protein [Verrucomicrobiota bacterium]